MKTLILALMFLLTAHCPKHDWAICKPDGPTQVVDGKTWVHFHCTCGDNYWYPVP